MPSWTTPTTTTTTRRLHKNMDAVKRLMTIDKRLAEANQALRAVSDEERKAKAELQSAEAALVDHFQQEDHDPLPQDLHANLAAARNRAAQPWQQRREGKQRLVRQIEVERGEFIRTHLGELAQSKEPAAHAAQERMIRALEEVEEAVRDWQGVAQHFAGLLSVVAVCSHKEVHQLRLDA